jgi:hypothetical protein
MNLLSGHKSYTAAAAEITPDEFRGHPFCARLVSGTEAKLIVDKYFDFNIVRTAVKYAKYDVHEIHGEGVYGYVLTTYDNRDVPSKFFAHPDL